LIAARERPGLLLALDRALPDFEAVVHATAAVFYSWL